MHAIRYRITSLSPLLFASNTGDPNMVATLDYIPGTHLRGMFATEYIKRKDLGVAAHKDETFYNWFLKGELKFTNAYIVWEKIDKTHRLLPIPLSIQREKGHEVTAYDLLFQEEEFDKQTTGISGYGNLEGSILYKKGVKKSLNFHHARDREKGVSKEGQIFNYESINQGQTFEGFIIGQSDDLREFTSIISSGIYYLGRSRNNQYGKIRFEIVSKEPEEFYSEINLKQESAENIVLTLLSDTIIYNEHGFSTTDTRELEKLLNCKITKSFIRQSEEEGFISVWKLKTPSEVCFKAGSCFLLENADIERLKELQKTGIGMRTHEGFGRFVIGWQGEDKPFNIKEVTDEIKPTKPHGALPESGKKLVEDIIKGQIKKQIQIKAINDAGEFKNLPTKSLLAKIEGAVKDGTLKTLLDNLKKTAKDKLEHCRNEDTDLYEFLKSFSLNMEDEMRNMPEIKKICEEISYKPEEKLKAELEKTYLLTFLSTMRKRINQLEKKKK
jgi:CRISPR-associated protein Csx10